MRRAIEKEGRRYKALAMDARRGSLVPIALVERDTRMEAVEGDRAAVRCLDEGNLGALRAACSKAYMDSLSKDSASDTTSPMSTHSRIIPLQQPIY